MSSKSNLSRKQSTKGSSHVVLTRVHQGVAYLSIGRAQGTSAEENTDTLDPRAAALAALNKVDENPSVLGICLHSSLADIWTDAGVPSITGPSVTSSMSTPPVTLNAFCARLEACHTPTVVAAYGTISGARLALALAAHFRISEKHTRFMVPDVSMGCVPEGGITQRLPRLVGVKTAMALCLDGQVLTGGKAHKKGLVHAVVEALRQDVVEAYCAEKLVQPTRPTPTCDLIEHTANGRAYLAAISARREKMRSSQLQAPEVILQCLEAALLMPFDAGIDREEAAACEAKNSEQARSLLYSRQAEQRSMKAPRGVDLSLGRAITSIGLLGTARPALDLAHLALDKGLKVHIVARDANQAILAVRKISVAYARFVEQGKISAQTQKERMSNLAVSASTQKFSSCDFVIDMRAGPLEPHAKALEELEQSLPQDIGLAVIRDDGFGELSKRLQHPERLVGFRFFQPIHGAKCTELVATQMVSPAILATAHMLVRTLAKLPVHVAAHDGLIARPMQSAVWEAVDVMLLMGVRPSQIDGALRNYGLGVGPCEIMDKMGLDKFSGVVPQLLSEVGDTGRAAGRGFFEYSDEAKGSQNDDVSFRLILQLREQAGIARVTMSAREICERIILAQANAGARLLQNGTAEYPVDIDTIMIFAKGAPKWRGGPMFEADKMGALAVYNKLRAFSQEAPDIWEPEPLWAELVKNGDKLSDLDAL